MTDNYRILANQMAGYAPKLSDREERAYFDIIGNTSVPMDIRMAAARKVTENHLRFAMAVASRYAGPRFPLEELADVAVLGMYRAALMFDPKRGTRFISYAVWWARMYVQDYIYDTGDTVRIPESKLASLRKLRDLEESGTDPETVFSRKELAELRSARAARDVVSADDPVDPDSPDGPKFGDLAATAPMEPEISARETSRRLLEDIRKVLPDRDYDVLARSFGVDGGPDLELKEIADLRGRSRERIRSIRNSAIQRLGRVLSRENYDLEAVLGS